MQHCLWLCTSEVWALCPSSGDSWERPSLYINNTGEFSLSLHCLCLCPLLIFHWILWWEYRDRHFDYVYRYSLCVWVCGCTFCACVCQCAVDLFIQCVSICAYTAIDDPSIIVYCAKTSPTRQGTARNKTSKGVPGLHGSDFRCSIAFRSVENEGQGNTSNSLSCPANNSWAFFAVWQGSLSCRNKQLPSENAN